MNANMAFVMGSVEGHRAVANRGPLPFARRLNHHHVPMAVVMVDYSPFDA